MDILEILEKGEQEEEVLAQYRKGNREPLLKLFDSYKQNALPPSLHRGIRSLLQKKKGTPPTIGPAERVNRLNMAIFVNIFHKEGDILEVAVEKVATIFDTSDGIVKHAYLKHYPSPRSRSKKH